MSLLPVLLILLRALILLLAGAAAVAAIYAGWKWRHDRRRFGLCLFAGSAAVILVVLTAGALLHPDPARLGTWLRLLPDLALPILLVALLRSLRRHDIARRAAAAASPINPATGLPNRAGLLALVRPALARCRREGVPCSALAASLDGTAAIEAERGPAAVEELQRDFATVFRDTLRGGDLPGHIRGEVLAALLPGTPAEAARALGARLREEISSRLAHPAMDGRVMTISVGVAPIGGGAASPALDEALAASEAAMAAARDKGGNNVQIAEPPPLRSAGAC